ARAVAYAALGLGPAAVVVAARRVAQAEALVGALAPGPGVLRACALAEAPVAEAALVVNATPAGMWPHDDATPWPDARAFRPGQVVYDLVYRPRRTRLLREAAARGATTIDGLPMLLGQAAAAYRLWTGRPMPLGPAREAALAALGDDARPRSR
ncbi:MAG: shikimate dehydrogenase family protein, partial [Rubricoccaceae bacterium]